MLKINGFQQPIAKLSKDEQRIGGGSKAQINKEIAKEVRAIVGTKPKAKRK